MPNYRKDRINGAVTREMSDIIREIKDPRISDALLTVSGAEVTGDLKYATIYYSTLAETDEKALRQGLKSAAPFMRRCLAERLNLRVTPELNFKRDDGVKHGADIAALLHKIHEEMKDSGDGNDGEAVADRDENDGEVTE